MWSTFVVDWFLNLFIHLQMSVQGLQIIPYTPITVDTSVCQRSKYYTCPKLMQYLQDCKCTSCCRLKDQSKQQKETIQEFIASQVKYCHYLYICITGLFTAHCSTKNTWCGLSGSVLLLRLQHSYWPLKLCEVHHRPPFNSPLALRTPEICWAVVIVHYIQQSAYRWC